MTHWLHTSSCDAVRPICQGYIPVASGDAATALHQAAQNTVALHRYYQTFMEKDAVEPNRRSMEPRFFMTRMRIYLLTYPIQGESWGGVNAANLAAQMQLDYLMGTTDEQYAEPVRKRRRYLIPEDWHALEADMALPSVADVVLQQLELTPQEVITCNDPALEAHIAKQSPELQASLIAYAQLFQAAGKLTAMHWALIKYYLDKEAAKLSPEERARLPVPPDHGTGGASHAETMAIRDRRLKHPMLKKLTQCINQALRTGS